MKQKPKSEEAKEALGRVLLGRDRERELLQRFADDSGRRMALLRGIAWGRLKDWKRARAELTRTSVSGKFPIEAVAWLALADAAEGEPDKAQTVLEKTLGAAKRPARGRRRRAGEGLLAARHPRSREGPVRGREPRPPRLRGRLRARTAPLDLGLSRARRRAAAALHPAEPEPRREPPRARPRLPRPRQARRGPGAGRGLGRRRILPAPPPRRTPPSRSPSRGSGRSPRRR